MAAADASAVALSMISSVPGQRRTVQEDWKKYQDPAAAGITLLQNAELVATLCKDDLDSQK